MNVIQLIREYGDARERASRATTTEEMSAELIEANRLLFDVIAKEIEKLILR